MKEIKNLLLISLAVSTTLTTPIFTQENENNLLCKQDTVYAMDISSGSCNVTEFRADYTLSKHNCTKVNFYVENNGTEPIIIEINGSNSRTFEPGEFGHISASIKRKSQKFIFKARAGENGGKVNINYIIKQRY